MDKIVWNIFYYKILFSRIYFEKAVQKTNFVSFLNSLKPFLILKQFWKKKNHKPTGFPGTEHMHNWRECERTKHDKTTYQTIIINE